MSFLKDDEVKKIELLQYFAAHFSYDQLLKIKNTIEVMKAEAKANHMMKEIKEFAARNIQITMPEERAKTVDQLYKEIGDYKPLKSFNPK